MNFKKCRCGISISFFLMIKCFKHCPKSSFNIVHIVNPAKNINGLTNTKCMVLTCCSKQKESSRSLVEEQTTGLLMNSLMPSDISGSRLILTGRPFFLLKMINSLKQLCAVLCTCVSRTASDGIVYQESKYQFIR